MRLYLRIECTEHHDYRIHDLVPESSFFMENSFSAIAPSNVCILRVNSHLDIDALEMKYLLGISESMDAKIYSPGFFPIIKRYLARDWMEVRFFSDMDELDMPDQALRIVCEDGNTWKISVQEGDLANEVIENLKSRSIPYVEVSKDDLKSPFVL